MTETTDREQSAAEFTSYADFITRANVGDSFRAHEPRTRTITDWTVTGIQTDSTLSPRLLHLAGICTTHVGSPSHRYETHQITQRADSTNPGTLIFGRTDLRRLLSTTPTKRYSAKTLARLHEAYTAG